MKDPLPSDRTDATGSTFLRRLRSKKDQEAWHKLYYSYRPLFLNVCQQFGLRGADIDDVMQESIVVVYENIQGFERQRTGSFRKWLETITGRIAMRLLRSKKKQQPVDSDHLDDVASMTIHDIEEAERKKFELELFALACEAVSEEFPDAFEAFRLVKLESLQVVEVAKRLTVTVTTVHKRVSRVQREYLPRAIWKILSNTNGP